MVGGAGAARSPAYEVRGLDQTGGLDVGAFWSLVQRGVWSLLWVRL